MKSCNGGKLYVIVDIKGAVLVILKFAHCHSVPLLQDVASLSNFFQNTCGITPEEKQLSVSGRNWGEVDLNGWLPFLR